MNRIIAPNNLIVSSSRIGGIDDVYDGFDVDVNARLGRGVLLSGGVSVGRERIDNCNLIDDRSLSFGGLRTEPYCDQRPPFQPQMKGQLAYPLPWDVSVAATFQSLSGPQLSANYPLSNAIAEPSLGRPFTGVAPTIDLLPWGTLYGDRIWPDGSANHARVPHRPHDDSADGLDLQPVQLERGADLQPDVRPRLAVAGRHHAIEFVDIGVQIDF